MAAAVLALSACGASPEPGEPVPGSGDEPAEATLPHPDPEAEPTVEPVAATPVDAERVPVPVEADVPAVEDFGMVGNPVSPEGSSIDESWPEEPPMDEEPPDAMLWMPEVDTDCLTRAAVEAVGADRASGLVEVFGRQLLEDGPDITMPSDWQAPPLTADERAALVGTLLGCVDRDAWAQNAPECASEVGVSDAYLAGLLDMILFASPPNDEVLSVMEACLDEIAQEIADEMVAAGLGPAKAECAGSLLAGTTFAFVEAMHMAAPDHGLSDEEAELLIGEAVFEMFSGTAFGLTTQCGLDDADLEAAAGFTGGTPPYRPASNP